MEVFFETKTFGRASAGSKTRTEQAQQPILGFSSQTEVNPTRDAITTSTTYSDNVIYAKVGITLSENKQFNGTATAFGACMFVAGAWVYQKASNFLEESAPLIQELEGAL